MEGLADCRPSEGQEMNAKMETQTTQGTLRQVIRPAVAALVLFTVITGVLYPLLITGVAQVAFPQQANGSLLRDADGNVIGSALIGQQFSDPAYFWGRLSATGPVPYNAAASSGSNYGPLNPALIGEDGAIQGRIDALREADARAGVTNTLAIPVDLVTASGSGLDPQISPAAAQYQIARIAALRGTDAAAIQALVDAHTEGRWLGVLGEPRVNVLALNLALDAEYPLAGANE
jgi:K+-transporting ATPase ATPase C chain